MCLWCYFVYITPPIHPSTPSVARIWEKLRWCDGNTYTHTAKWYLRGWTACGGWLRRMREKYIQQTHLNACPGNSIDLRFGCDTISLAKRFVIRIAKQPERLHPRVFYFDIFYWIYTKEKEQEKSVLTPIRCRVKTTKDKNPKRQKKRKWISCVSFDGFPILNFAVCKSQNECIIWKNSDAFYSVQICVVCCVLSVCFDFSLFFFSFCEVERPNRNTQFIRTAPSREKPEWSSALEIKVF